MADIQNFDALVTDLETINQEIQSQFKMQIIHDNSLHAILAAGTLFSGYSSNIDQIEISSSTNLASIQKGEIKDTLFIFIGQYTEDIAGFTQNSVLISHTPLPFVEFSHRIHPANYGYSRESATLASICYFLTKNHLLEISKRQMFIPLLSLYVSQANLFCEPLIKGLNEIFYIECKERQLFEEKMHFSFLGQNIFSISETLYLSVSPLLPGLTANNNGLEQLLNQTDILIETQGLERKFSSLQDFEIKELNGKLIVKLLQTQNSGASNLLMKRPVLSYSDLSLHHYPADFSHAVLEQFYQHEYSLIFSALFGDRHAIKEMKEQYTLNRRNIVTNIHKLIAQINEDVNETLITYSDEIITLNFVYLSYWYTHHYPIQSNYVTICLQSSKHDYYAAFYKQEEVISSVIKSLSGQNYNPLVIDFKQKIVIILSSNPDDAILNLLRPTE